MVSGNYTTRMKQALTYWKGYPAKQPYRNAAPGQGLRCGIEKFPSPADLPGKAPELAAEIERTGYWMVCGFRLLKSLRYE